MNVIGGGSFSTAAAKDFDRSIADNGVIMLADDRRAGLTTVHPNPERFQREAGLAKIDPMAETDGDVHRACVAAPNGGHRHLRIPDCPIQELHEILFLEDGLLFCLVVHQCTHFQAPLPGSSSKSIAIGSSGFSGSA